MVLNRANLQGLFIAYTASFNKAFTEAKPTYTQIATVVPSSTGSQSYGWLGQMPRVREWVGAREIQNLEAHEYTITNKKFELTVSVPRSDIEDDNYGVYTPMIAGLGQSAAMHPDELIYKMLRDGFENKCYDGKPFFSADHQVGYATYSNVSDAPLSEESYMAARTAIMSVCGENGESMNLIPDLLVVSPRNEYAAKLILEADQIDGTSNILKGTAKVLVSTELAKEGKENCWFLLCTTNVIKPLIYQKRREMKMVSKDRDEDDNVFEQDKYIYGVDGRGNAGYGFWQMAYGSTGTRAAAALAWQTSMEQMKKDLEEKAVVEPEGETVAERTAEPEPAGEPVAALTAEAEKKAEEPEGKAAEPAKETAEPAKPETKSKTTK